MDNTTHRIERAAPTRSATWLAALALLAVAVAPAGAGELALAPGDTSPKMVAWTLDGDLTTVEWQGLTLFNFWATWCEACRLEMPELQKIQDEFAEQGLRIYGVNREFTSVDEVRTFLEGTGVKYPQLKPDKRLAKGWEGINVLPTSFLVNADGKILRKYVGASPRQVEGLREDIDNVLHGRPMGPMIIEKPEVVQTKVYEKPQ